MSSKGVIDPFDPDQPEEDPVINVIEDPHADPYFDFTGWTLDKDGFTIHPPKSTDTGK